MSVDPLGRFVYVAYGYPSAKHVLLSLSVDSNTGVLSRIASPVALDGDAWLVTHPSGKFLYVGNTTASAVTATASAVTVFSVDPANGTLTPVPGSPFEVGSGPGSVDIEAADIDPSGNYLYLADYVSGNIFAYAIDQRSGQLAPINGSPFPTGPKPLWVLVEPLGHFVYVSNDLGVSAYEIDGSNGALTPVSGSPFPLAFGGRISFSY
jgi:6-phosphogluconolactonase (cycloisomerase 2 family)